MRTSEEKQKRKLKYTSVKAMAEKLQAGYQASYLKLTKGFKLYRPKAGKALLDIIPYVAGAGNPMADEGEIHWERTFWVHRGIGANQETFVCPAKTMGQRCPICEARMELAESDDDDDEKLRKDLMPKQRQLFNIIDLKNPDAGIQILETSSFSFGEPLIEAVQSADEEDEGQHWDLFFTLDNGLSLRVLWTEEKFGAGKFIKASRIDFKERSEEYGSDILDKVASLDEMLKILDYKELKKAFQAIAAKKKQDDEEDEDDEDEDTDSEGDDDEEESPKAKKKKPGKDDDDEDGEWPDENEDEKPKAKKKKKPEPEEEEDEDGDEDSEDDEESDEDEDEKPKKKKPAEDEDEDGDEEEKPKSKKSEKEVPDDDDDDWSDGPDDEEDDEESDEDEDEKPKKKKKARSEDDDED
jgi:hypothetical protein